MVNFKYILLIAIIFISCSSTKKEENEKKEKLIVKNCINESNQDVEITWGKYIKAENKYLSYKLTTTGDVYRINKDDSETAISNIYTEEYCDVYISLQKTFLKYQTVRIPADTAKFIYLTNPKLKSDFKAMWNPNYETVSNKSFNKIFNLLNQTLPKSKLLRHRD